MTLPVLSLNLASVASGDQRSTPVCGEDIVDAKASFDVLQPHDDVCGTERFLL
jgi:hypothetical protein